MRTAAVGLVTFALAAGCGEDKLKGPEAEVRKSDVKLSIPPVPSFDLPASKADGHSVKELRVKGKKLLETEITVKGFVTWAYDCPTAVREPGEDDKAVKDKIDKDPTICERVKFYVGDAKETPAEKSLWVVDVPRPWNKLELERIKEKDRKTDPSAASRCEPKEKDPKKSICPPYAVGDEVEVTGTWRLSSPHSERNSDGLLVYKKMKNLTQNYESPAPETNATGTPATAPNKGGGPPAKPSPTDIVKKSGKAG
ncbi:MAG: hypothetical protein ABI867_37715 [Kofleriaceae bacterium]